MQAVSADLIVVTYVLGRKGVGMGAGPLTLAALRVVGDAVRA